MTEIQVNLYGFPVLLGEKNKGAGTQYSGTLYSKIVGLFTFIP